MIDKVKTMESFLEALDSNSNVFNLVYRNGRKIECPLVVPQPAAEIALRIIKGEKKEGKDD